MSSSQESISTSSLTRQIQTAAESPVAYSNRTQEIEGLSPGSDKTFSPKIIIIVEPIQVWYLYFLSLLLTPPIKKY